ncbi:MAG: class I SAM-dependent methyltransferase [Bacteroidales bacterium]|nr:class I SAM-dependent methyltransferase [Bacteroidales bacterium]
MDWRDEESQQLRFRQLLKILSDDKKPFSIIDFGCGYGALFEMLATDDREFSYHGYDAAEAIVDKGREMYAGDGRASFSSRIEELPVSDYVVCSGVWNVKGEANTEAWERYVLSGLESLNSLCTRGFSFNILTSYVDDDRRRSDLYYADPGFYFKYCKTHFSRNVALLHDYNLYEFTMLVGM